MIDGGFFHLGEEHDPESLWSAMNLYRQYLGTSALPFADDGGGGVYFLDVSTSPAVVRFARRGSVDDIGVTTVAASFAELIDGLHLHPDFI